ncbi:MAG: OmpH family outer membrane protein [Bacteroidales bacterium]|nr:OmpH family outer membrane protein [Bacteroidales bacterium]
MKRITGAAILVFMIVFAGQAQSFKFGHINSDELIQALPEFDTASKKLETFRQELLNTLEIMQVEFNNKNDVYGKEQKNLTELVRQTKEQELIDLNRRIQDFQVKANDDLQAKQAELFQPIMAKVDKAIKDVGKENGFLYIFSVGQGTPLLFFDETKSTNIMPLAKAKLGLK